ncbi:MAG TPA: hypothetical protein VE978_22870 [Chitinophagales bacterium]|nr:hypothetical protein [Chitinophagales bacterium]
MRVVIFVILIYIVNHRINYAQSFNSIDSTIITLPFTSDDKPALNLYLKGDTFCLLNIYGNEFYLLDRHGEVHKKLMLSKLLNPKLPFYPVTFTASSNYYIFWDGRRILMLDKFLKFYGFYSLRDTIQPHYINTNLFSLFFSESNNRFYYSSVTGFRDSTKIQSLTSEYYSEKFLTSFYIPRDKKKDSSTLHRLYTCNYYISRPSIFGTSRGYLPHLDFRDLFFDENNKEIIISEAADSLIYGYDLNGNKLYTFGRKGRLIQGKDSIRFITTFDQYKYNYIRGAFSCFLDSIKYQSAQYLYIKSNSDLQLVAREYVVPDTVNIVAGAKINYHSFEIERESLIKRSYYIQIYDHHNLVKEIKVPQDWQLVGFENTKLVFYKLFRDEKDATYKLLIYYIS